MFVWRANYWAQFDSGTEPSGAQYSCAGGSFSGCTEVAWAGADLRAFLQRDGGPPSEWLGSLAAGHRDQSGNIYMRNRYYDPGTGQFTQRDPIGLAGGLNLYGFAGGDPINFSDPFGLTPCKDKDGQEIPCPEPEGGPPIELPNGRGPSGDLVDNEWVKGPKPRPGRRQTYKPRYPIPGGSQPGASWDPKGHWDADDGTGTRRRYRPDGTEVDHDNNPLNLQITPPSAEVVAGISAGVIAYWIISELSRLFPPRNLIPVP